MHEHKEIDESSDVYEQMTPAVQRLAALIRKMCPDKDKWSRYQYMTELNQDYLTALVSKSLQFADQKRELGYNISDERVCAILCTPHRLLDNASPVAFCDNYNMAERTFLIVCEEIGNEIGIVLQKPSNVIEFNPVR